MLEYAVYLESGPRRQKTMVHVLALLGCFAQGATTEAALEATPGAIRGYRRFLESHGEVLDPDEEVALVVAEHVMEGPWLGNGNPAPGFKPDFDPVARDEVQVLCRRLRWLHSGLAELVRGIPGQQLTEQSRDGGWPVARLVEHVLEAEAAYLRSALGPIEPLSAALRAMRQHAIDLGSALIEIGRISADRLEAMTDAERSRLVPRGQVTWTARRAFRRSLEHDWEHLQQLSRIVERAV